MSNDGALDPKASSSISVDAQQFYRSATEIGLNAGDAGGYQSDFFERFLRSNSDNIKDETIRIVKTGYIFTQRVVASRSKKNGKKQRAHNLLTASQKREFGLFNVAKDDLKYGSFLKIHELWKNYFREAIGTEKATKLEALQVPLMKADYTGCHFVVAAALCTSLVGLKGLVIQETKNVFRLISQDDRVVTVPKRGTLFAFTHDDKLYKIYGSHFRRHGFERGKTKFKVTENILL